MARPAPDAANDYRAKYPDSYPELASLLAPNALNDGIKALEGLSERFRSLVAGELDTIPDDHLDGGYAVWHVYFVTDAVKRVAREDWVSRHLRDIRLLIQSPALSAEEKAVVKELFGVESFHVAVQGNPVSDGLVKEIATYPGDRKEFIRRVAGRMTDYGCAFGSYPPLFFGPPHIPTLRCIATHGGAFDAVPARGSLPWKRESFGPGHL